MNNEHKIIVFTFAAHFLFHFYEIVFPAMAVPLMLSLNMSLAEVLQLGFLMYLFFGLASLPWGIFADRYGNRLSLVIFFIGSSVGAIFTGFSHSSTAIMLSLAVIGFFASIYHPAGMGLISIGAANRGMALGINGMAGSIGLATAPFAAGILNWLVGWRLGYFLIGVFGIIWGICISLVRIDETPVRNEKEEIERLSGGGLKNFLILCLIVTLGGLAYRINIVVLPAYLEFKAGFLGQIFQNIGFSRMEGLTTVAATFLTSLVYIVGIFGQLTGGRLADKHDLRRLYLGFNAVSLPFVVLMAVASGHLLVLGAALYVFFAIGIQPIENSLIAKLTPGHRRSTGYGITSILIFGVGSLAIYAIGWIKGTWNLEAVYLFSGLLITLILACIFWLNASLKEKECRN